MWLPEFLRDPWVPTIARCVCVCVCVCLFVSVCVYVCVVCVVKFVVWVAACCWYDGLGIVFAAAFGLRVAGDPQWCEWGSTHHLDHSYICILAEGAIALSVTLSGGALFASWKLLQFPSSLIVKVILAIFSGASAQQWQQRMVCVPIWNEGCVMCGEGLG